MTDRAHYLLREALALSAEERADLAAELLASLDDSEDEDPAAVEAAWAAEIERRADRALSGEDPGESWEDVHARITRHLRER